MKKQKKTLLQQHKKDIIEAVKRIHYSDVARFYLVTPNTILMFLRKNGIKDYLKKDTMGRIK